MLKRWWMLLILLVPLMAVAEGPEFTKGAGAVVNIGCEPPTTRAANADGVEVPLALTEIAETTLFLISGTADGPVVAQVQAEDYYCTYTWLVDDYQAGQYYIRATATSTDGGTSVLSPDYAPFLSLLPLGNPNAPSGLRHVGQ